MGKQIEKEITREFNGSELRAMGLPARCNGGEVLEDRLVQRVDVPVKKPGRKHPVTVVEEYHFLAFQLGSDIWGIPYTVHEDGTVTFDEKVIATRYEYRMLLVPAEEFSEEKRKAA